MNVLYTLLSNLLLCSLVLGNEEIPKEGELKREKKDISKLQALLGLNKGKQIPVVSLQEWKRPLYYVPPCNCWRPATRYGVPADESAVVYQPARPSVVLPAQPAIRTPSLVIPAEPAIRSQPQPSLVVPAEPGIRTQPEPSVVIPAQPAIRTLPSPGSLIIPAQPAFVSPPPSYVIPAEPARYVPPRFYPSNPQPFVPSSPALSNSDEPCIQRGPSDGYQYDRPQAPLNH